jgi:cell division protein FtsW (lipid II flippase)
MFNFKQYDFKRYSILLLVVVLILGSIGAYLIMQVQPKSEVIWHMAGLIGGMLGAIVLSLIDYHFISMFYIVLYVINLILLILVRVNGVTINHAKRWLSLGFVSFQPSELTKIILIIFVAKLFSILRSKINNFFVLFLAIVSVGIPTFLILIQTNLSYQSCNCIHLLNDDLCGRTQLEDYPTGACAWYTDRYGTVLVYPAGLSGFVETISAGESIIHDKSRGIP